MSLRPRHLFISCGLVCLALIGTSGGCADRERPVLDVPVSAAAPKYTAVTVAIESATVPLVVTDFNAPTTALEAQFLIEPSHLKWSRDNRFISVLENYSRIRILDAASGQVKRTLSLPLEISKQNAAANARIRHDEWLADDRMVAYYKGDNDEGCGAATWRLSSDKGRFFKYPCSGSAPALNLERFVFVSDSEGGQILQVAAVSDRLSSFQRQLPRGRFVQYALSPDRSNLAIAGELAGGKDSLLEVWDTTQNRLLFSRVQSGKQSFFWDDHGQRIALKSEVALNVMNLEDGQIVEQRFSSLDSGKEMRFCRFDPESKQLLFLLDDTKQLRHWNPLSGKVQFLTTDDYPDAHFSPNGESILVLEDFVDRKFRLWRPSEDKTKIQMSSDNELRTFRFSGDGKRLVWLEDEAGRLAAIEWDLVQGKPIRRSPFRNPTHDVTTFIRFPDSESSAISPDGTMVAAVLRRDISREVTEARLEVREITTDDILSQLPLFKQRLSQSFAFSESGDTLAVAQFYADSEYGPGGRVDAWGLGSQMSFNSRIWPEHAVNTVAISHDGKRIAAGGANLVRVYDGRNLRLLVAQKAHDPWVHKVEWSPDDSQIASAAGYEESLKIWNSLTGRVIRSLSGGAEHHTNVFSPDGSWVVTDNVCRGSPRPFHIWSRGNGKEFNQFEMPEELHMFRWSPDSRMLILWLDTQWAIARDIEQNKVLDEVRFPEDAKDIVATGWHPSGREIIFVDKGLRYFRWKIDDEKNNSTEELQSPDLKQYNWDQNTGHSFAIRADGKLLAIGNGTSVILIRPDTGESLTMEGYLENGKLGYLVHDGQGNAWGEGEYPALYRLRKSNSLNAELTDVPMNPDTATSFFANL